MHNTKPTVILQQEYEYRIEHYGPYYEWWMMFKLPLHGGVGRLSFAGARNGDLPTVLALINVKFFTPITSLVSQVSRHRQLTGNRPTIRQMSITITSTKSHPTNLAQYLLPLSYLARNYFKRQPSRCSDGQWSTQSMNYLFMMYSWFVC